MERGALSTAEFKEFAKDYVLFCHITSHIEGDKYQDLLMQKGGSGFPYVVAMNADGDVLSVLGYPRTVDAFRTMMNDGKEFEDLLAKKDRTHDEEVDLFFKRLGLHHFDPDEARAEVAKLGELTEEQQERADQAILSLDIDAHAPKSQADLPKSGEAFAKMYAEGRVPTEERPFQTFFICILEYAYSQKDAALFEDALGKLKEKFGSNPRAAGFFAKQEGRLAELKAQPAGDH